MATATSPRAHRGVALAVLCASVFVINVDSTIVNIALPALVRQLGSSTRDLQWVVDAYNLTFAALVLAAGSLGDRYGRKGSLVHDLAARQLIDEYRLLVLPTVVGEGTRLFADGHASDLRLVSSEVVEFGVLSRYRIVRE